MVTTTVMVVEDDPAFLARFCRIVAQSTELSLLAAVSDLTSARRAIEHARARRACSPTSACPTAAASI